LSQGRIRLFAAATLHQNFAAHGDELGGATGEREDRRRVGITGGNGTRDVDPKGGEVGILPYLERSDSLVEPERKRKKRK
jgi:hypothetical protein